MQQSEYKGAVGIKVSDPEVKKQYGGAKQYYLYSVRGEDAKGSFEIHRRYSDFDLIRSLLIKRWPGCFIPSLPSKIKLTQSDEQFLETRGKYLQKFLVEVAKKKFLWESDEMQLFLRNSVLDFDKVLSGLWKVDPQQLIYRYENLFKELSSEDEARLAQDIESFSKYLSTLLVKLQELRNRSQELHDAQSKYQRKYSKFLVQVLSSYQTKFLSYYYEGDNKSDVSIFSAQEHGQRKQELIQTLKEVPLKILFEELKRQKREILSFQDVIHEREDYLKQKARLQGKIKDHQLKIMELKNGKKSFFEKVMSASTETEIKNHEKSLEKYRRDLEVYEKICRYISLIIGTLQIKNFKEERIYSYYKMVQQIAREEINIIEKERQFWMAVAQSPHLDLQIQERGREESRAQLSEIVEGQKDISQGHYEIEGPPIRQSKSVAEAKPAIKQLSDKKQGLKIFKKSKSSEKQNAEGKQFTKEESAVVNEVNKDNIKANSKKSQSNNDKLQDTKSLKQASSSIKQQQQQIQRRASLRSIVKIQAPDFNEPTQQLDDQQFGSPRHQEAKQKPLPEFFADHT